METRKRARKIIEKRIGRRLGRYEVVHHKNGNIDDNRLSNLSLMSLSDHSSLHMRGRTLPTETKIKLQQQSRNARPGAILSIEDVYDIRKMLVDRIGQGLIAFAFGVNKRSISDIKTGKSWSWI